MRIHTLAAIAIMAVVPAAALAAEQDGGWAQLQRLKSGTELKVWERGSAQPRTLRFADATDENLIVLVKSTQVAIAKEKIDRVDYRPLKKGPSVSKTTKTETAKPTSDGAQGPTAGPHNPDTGGQSYSSSTSVSFDAGEFQTVYRRVTGAPAQK